MNKKTIIVKLNDENWIEQLSEPAEILRRGGTVAFPTETVYGLGANALDETAIKGIYEAKGRPSDNPLIVHISNLEMLDDLVEEIQPYARELMTSFWPGPVTFVFSKKQSISNIVTGGLNTIAVRMPKHPVAIELIKQSGVPVAAPSANLSGKPSPTIAEYVIEDMSSRVDCIVCGEDCEVGLESSVIDVTGAYPVVLRPGKITREDIEAIVGRCEIDPAIENHDVANTLVPKSPGMKYKHYAPDAEVSVYTGDKMRVIKAIDAYIAAHIQERTIGLMIFDEDYAVIQSLLEGYALDKRSRVLVRTQGTVKNLEIFAKNLFKDLRDLDAAGCDVILIHGVDSTGYGRAIMNRLTKASEGRVIEL